MSLPRPIVCAAAVSALALCVAAAGCEHDDPLPYYDYGYGEDYPTSACGEVPACDESVNVASDGAALMVTDPAALTGLDLETVLKQVILSAGGEPTTPVELVQRMFDSVNTDADHVYTDQPHCDSYDNFANSLHSAAFCPRAEGVLADSASFFVKGDPDHFYPVAVVNRFDLASIQADNCGEYRIVYAKESGRTDPNNRVFIIVEATLPNPDPGCMLGCRPVAEFWKSLELESDPVKVGERVSAFMLQGLPESGVVAPIQASNVGLGPSGASYYGSPTGQLRISEHMADAWQLRQLGLTFTNSSKLRPEPRAAGNNPSPWLFTALEPGEYDPYREDFISLFPYDNVASLAKAEPTALRMTVSLSDLSGESALGGPSLNDYALHAKDNVALHQAINAKIEELDLNADCPEDDPLTSDSILRRATMESCAGCHAPAQLLGPERKLGCGLTWPDSLGEVHIDENGNRSPALKEVFLPHRAEVLTTYLRSCDEDAIILNFGGTPTQGSSLKSSGGRRTLGGSSTH